MVCLTHLHAALWVNQCPHDGAGAQRQAVGQLVLRLQLRGGEERLEACRKPSSLQEGLHKSLQGRTAQLAGLLASLSLGPSSGVVKNALRPVRGFQIKSV